MVAAAPRALYRKSNSTDSIPSNPLNDKRSSEGFQYDTTIIDCDREEVGYQISAGNGDGEKAKKLAAEKSNSLTSMPSAYSGVARRAGSRAGLAPGCRAAAQLRRLVILSARIQSCSRCSRSMKEPNLVPLWAFQKAALLKLSHELQVHRRARVEIA